MKTAKDVLKAIKDNDVKYVDFALHRSARQVAARHLRPGRWSTRTSSNEGTMFDGSSIAGWKAINESDMLLMPDPSTATWTRSSRPPPWSSSATSWSRSTASPIRADPRGMAKKAEAYLKSTGIGDTAYFGPEAEFFIFDDVRSKADPYNTGFKLDSSNCRQQRHRL
jgi:glutamine synthetase